MTTLQFKREIDSLGYSILDDIGMSALYIMVGRDRIAWIDKEFEGIVNTAYYHFSKLPIEKRMELFSVISAYISTPIEKRGETYERLQL